MVVGALSVLTFACNGTSWTAPEAARDRTRRGPWRPGPGHLARPATGTRRNNPILPPPPGAAGLRQQGVHPGPRLASLGRAVRRGGEGPAARASTVPTILTPGRSAQQFVDFAELFEIGPATASDIRNSANAAAAEAVKNLDGLLACKGGEAPAACAGRFIDGLRLAGVPPAAGAASRRTG